MKKARLCHVLILALGVLFSVSCGSDSPGGGGIPAAPSGDIDGAYNGEFIVSDDTNDIFISGLTTFTIADGAISGTLTSSSDFDFPGDTASLSGDIIATSEPPFFDTTLTLNFETAPDYTVSGRTIYSEADRAFAGGDLTLRRDGTFVGGFTVTGKKE